MRGCDCRSAWEGLDAMGGVFKLTAPARVEFKSPGVSIEKRGERFIEQFGGFDVGFKREAGGGGGVTGYTGCATGTVPRACAAIRIGHDADPIGGAGEFFG